MAWTTDVLVESVRRLAQLPDTGSFSAQEILNAAHALILTRLAPAIRSIRENYGLTYQDTAFVAGQAAYRTPSRAQADTLRDILRVDAAGRAHPLVQLTTQQWVARDPTERGTPSAFAVIGSKVHVHPAPADASETLRLYFHRRASRLVPVDECALVLFVDGQTAKTGAYPDGFDFSSTFDIVQGQPAFDVLVDDEAFDPSATQYEIEITTAGGTSVQIAGGSGWSPSVGDLVVQGSIVCVVTFVTTPTIFSVSPGFQLAAGAAFGVVGGADFGADVDLTEVQEGDYLCQHMTTCVPGIPAEMHRALEHATAAQMLIEDDDLRSAAAMQEIADRALADALGMMTPRVEARAKAIINRSSPLRAGRRRAWGG